VLLVGTFRCIESICSRRVPSLVMTALFALSYLYAYELGVVIRPYAMGAGLGLLTNAYLRDALRGRRLRSAALGTAAGALCALCSTHAATLACGAFVAFAIVSLVRARSFAAVTPVLITLAALPFFGVLYYVIHSFPGRSAELNEDLKRTHDLFITYGLQAIRGSFTPQDWWLSASFGDPNLLDRIAWLRSWAPTGVAVGFIYSVILRLSRRWGLYRHVLVYDVLAIVVGWAPLLEIIVNHYWGSPRHHVFFSLPVVVVLAGWGLQAGREGLRWEAAPALLLMGPWFGFHFATSFRDLALDVRLPFSDSKAAAALLPANAHLVADSVTLQEGYMLWRPGIVMRGGDNAGRRLGYTAFDSAWHDPASIPAMVREECSVAPDRTYYSGSWGILASCLTLVRPESPHSEQTRPDERFDLSKVDCACVLRSP
jgi:hypothetical protein